MKKRWSLPVTAVGVVKLVVTNLGIFEITFAGFKLKVIAPGVTPDEVQTVTEAKILVPDDLKEFRVVDSV